LHGAGTFFEILVQLENERKAGRKVHNQRIAYFPVAGAQLKSAKSNLVKSEPGLGRNEISPTFAQSVIGF
jgi:hypothetical protein